MFKLTLLCLFVIQILSIQAKSYDQVVQDMEPLILHFHNMLAGQQSATHGSERMTLMSVSSQVYQGWLKIQRELEAVSVNIKNESSLIVEELGMTAHVDKIQHCLTGMNTAVSTLQNTIQTGADVCRSSANKNAFYVMDMIVYPLYEKQSSTHKQIDHVMVNCTSSGDAGKSLICITRNLYKIFDPELEKMQDEMAQELNKMRNGVEYTLIGFDMCNNIVIEKLVKKKSIVDNFRKCVEQVANHM